MGQCGFMNPFQTSSFTRPSEENHRHAREFLQQALSLWQSAIAPRRTPNLIFHFDELEPAGVPPPARLTLSRLLLRTAQTVRLHFSVSCKQTQACSRLLYGLPVSLLLVTVERRLHTLLVSESLVEVEAYYSEPPKRIKAAPLLPDRFKEQSKASSTTKICRKAFWGTARAARGNPRDGEADESSESLQSISPI